MKMRLKPRLKPKRALSAWPHSIDRRLLLQRQADIVEPVHQTALAERIDLEFHRAAVGAADFLIGQINGQGRVRAALGIVEQFVEGFLGNADRQNAVLETVVVEDVTERGGDDEADAEIEQRPWRMLAARTAAEIVAGNQHLGVAIGGLVEDEIGVLAAVVVVTLLREQSLAKAGPLDGLQILLGNYHVGIDIDDLQRCRNALQRGELFHRSTSGLEWTKAIWMRGLSRMTRS